jgi:hypothetical protein
LTDLTWDDVDPVWQECFALAWESLRARSIPIGAALRHSHVGTVRYAAPDPVWSGVNGWRS